MPLAHVDGQFTILHHASKSKTDERELWTITNWGSKTPWTKRACRREVYLIVQRMLKLASLILAGIVLILGIPRTSLASEIVWRIGAFDGSSYEFNHAAVDCTGDRESHTYVVGKSDPARDWFASQPGSSFGKKGYRECPFNIEFELPEEPKGLYTLKAALLHYTSRMPRLQIEINGHRGLYYQHPVLNYAAGDLRGVFLSIYSTASIAADLPTHFLRRGPNKLVLTAIDEPRGQDGSAGKVTPSNSRIIYDALELNHNPASAYSPSEVTVDVTPTVFYKSTGGHIVEMVDLFVRFGSRFQRGRVTLSTGKKKYVGELRPGHDFGEQLVELEVPEFSASMKGEATLVLDGRTRRFPTQLVPAKKWNLFVVPGEHLDIGYTDYQSKVAEVQSRTVDQAIEMTQQYPDFRFYLDGYWIAEQFLKSRSDEQQKRFLRLVSENKIFVPAQYANLWTGIPTLETLIRSLYPSYNFHVQHGGNFDYANITDVPSYTWSYPSVMAAAGLKYFIAACDNYHGPMLLLGRLHKRSPFWWEGPDGARILMWYSRHYHQIRTLFDMPPQVVAGHDNLPIFLQNYTRPEYKPDAVIVFGTDADSTDLFPQQAGLVAEWSKVYAYPRLVFSGFAEAMENIARQLGDSIPTLRGDGGPYCEDGATADAFYASLERQNEQRALSAEKFSTISSLVNPRLQPDRQALHRLWDNMVLMDEHTWESSRSVSDPESMQSVRQRAVKDSRAVEAMYGLEQILERSMAAIADYIPNGSGTLVVFNSLNWQRSGLVEFDLDKGLELVDLTTKEAVPFEVLSSGHHYRHIRFLATDIPSVGYKCYALRPSKSESQASPTLTETTLESPYYRVVLDPPTGAVKSIFDKQLQKELVNISAPYRFGQYVYVTGADELPNRLIQYRAISPLPNLEPHGAGGGRLISITKVPFGTVARLESSIVNTPRVQTEIVLFDAEKKIQFINHVHKTKVYTKEGVYFAFPFAMSRPRFLYEIQNGFVDPEKDQLPGAGKEWFTVQRWLSVNQDAMTAALVPVDAHMVTLGDIARGTWPTEFGQRNGAVFSYIMNNYTDTNTVGGQGGDFTFRYVVTSDRTLDPGTLSRFGAENMTPLETNEIRAQDKAVIVQHPLDPAEGSFLETNQTNVLLVTWKHAEDGIGTILRFVELSGHAGTASVSSPLLNVERAWKCNAMEKNEQALSVSPHGFNFAVKPFEIVTVRAQGTPALE
jgi:alpha-mannosidase